MLEINPDPISPGLAKVELTQDQIDALAATDKTYREIEAEYGEETAINVGIARDPDAPELDEEWFANARKWMAENPEIVRQMKGKKFRWPAKEWVNIPIDFDILDHFRKDGAGWHGRLNDVLRRAVFGSEAP